MADYNINAATRRVVLSGSAGTGPYSFTFAVLVQTDLAVYLNSTKLTLTTDFTVSIATNGTGTVTLNTGTTNVPNTPGASDSVIIVGARALERTTDFVTAGDLRASALNEQLDANVIFDQQLAEENQRTLKAPVFDPATTEGGGTVDMTLPAKDTRKGKYLAFNNTTGNPEVGPSVSDVNAVSAAAADIALLADIQDGTTATNAITTVAAANANITTLAAIASSITAVAAKAGLITSDFVADLDTLATSDIVSDLNTLATADIVADLNRLATADIVADLNTLATADIVSDLNQLATTDFINDLNQLATTDFVNDLNSIATTAIINAITAVSGNSSNINAVSGNSTNINAVAGNSTNINTVAGANANIGTVAANIAGVNSFAERYRVGSTDPTSSLNVGDLFFNTSTNQLKYYTGSAWVTIIPSSAAPAIEDSGGSPVLATGITAAEIRTLIGAGTSSFDGAFSSLSGKPNTLSGYGITDALANNAVSEIAADGVPFSVNSTNSNTFKIALDDNGSVRGHIGASSSAVFVVGDGSGNVELSIDGSGNGTFTGNVTAFSDERLKSDVETLDGSKVYKMRGVSFTKNGLSGSGVIAQELEKVAPELVHSEGEYLSVAYGNITGYLIEALKEQDKRIQEQQKQIDELMQLVKVR